ncbi:sugar transferase [bacterium 210820-DFI.6.37]|nr:sugar transferase [bacterium 210820-DFI.6.37]
MIYTKLIKRFFSIVFSTFFIILLSPIITIVALMVRINLGSPVIFVQERAGLAEKTFKMFKFRTMTDERDSQGNLLPDKQRQTKLGRVLRKTSLDELPELMNILRGDMSFIGPRPLLVSYLNLYNEDQHKRHNVRPGLACISAIKGRNSIPWVERLEMDTYYAENISFKLDLWIAINTVIVVLFRKGCPDAAESSRVPITQALKKED